jgi:hypothetical protein
MLAETIRKYHNAGTADRTIRVIIGAVLIYFGFIDPGYIGQGFLAVLVGIMGLINILVAVTAVCPVYTLAGIRTCRAKEARSSEA